MATYSVLMLAAPARDHITGSLTQDDNLARRIDERLFRTHNYGEYPDPEGLLSTLPAIATPLIGILVGLWLSSFRRDVEKCAGLLAMGVFIAILGMCLHSWLMPINKKIWTPSFVVFTAGMGMLGLGAIYWLVDVNDRRRWALPFTIYGMNAIAAFVVAGIVTRIMYIIRFDDPRTQRTVSLLTFCRTEVADGVHHFAAMLAKFPELRGMIDTPQNTSLAYSLAYVVLILLLMSVLYAAKIFIKV
jgi:predicted acyltransferase